MNKILFMLALIASGSIGKNDNYLVPQVEIPKEYIKSLAIDNIPNNAVELKILRIIPSIKEAEEKEIYFKNMTHFTVDDRGLNYIVDSALCVIYQIDINGKLINKYEKRGHGPGEFTSPQKIFVKNNKIYVWDSMPMRMTIFNLNWEIENSFTLFEIITPNDISSDEKIICNNRRGDKVVNVLDINGNKILSYGEKPYPNKLISRLNESIIRISPDGSIYVGFSALGKIRKYSNNGKIEKELDIVERSSILIKELLDMNYSEDKNNTNIITPIIKSIAFIKDDVLIHLSGLVQPIIRINKYGDIIGYYYVKPKYGMENKCVYADIDENGNERYYLIQNDMSEQCVAVYHREK